MPVLLRRPCDTRDRVADVSAEHPHPGAGGPGEVVIPGLMKLKAKSTPATQDRPGVNPFTKEPTVIKGKPASRKIRATPIKALKDLVG